MALYLRTLFKKRPSWSLFLFDVFWFAILACKPYKLRTIILILSSTTVRNVPLQTLQIIRQNSHAARQCRPNQSGNVLV